MSGAKGEHPPWAGVDGIHRREPPSMGGDRRLPQPKASGSDALRCAT